VRLIRDQALRMIARGKDGREAAEAVVMPTSLRDRWEIYGQVESHVRQMYNGTVGWFGHDVYDINPLAIAEEARRTVELMGGAAAVRAKAAEAAAAGDIAGWQWALRLTSLLLQIDPGDADARRSRAVAARALGQRTTTSNARGWYITEALELEGKLLAMGKPVTIAQLRSFLGTPRPKELASAGTAANLAFLPVLVDPAKAGDRRLAFTIQVKTPWRIEMRNSVIVAEPAKAPLPDHVTLGAAELADFILGRGKLPSGGPLVALDAALDRSAFVFLPDFPAAALDGPATDAHLLGGGSQ
jgi:alkyl sulfatase BDS1-like metallo-beta-lactamase superfamily hydrolase